MNRSSFLTRLCLAVFLACSTIVVSAQSKKGSTPQSTTTSGNPQNNHNGNSNHDHPEIPDTHTNGNGPLNGNGHYDHGNGWGYGHHKNVPIDGGLGVLAAAGVLYGVKRVRDGRKGTK